MNSKDSPSQPPATPQPIADLVADLIAEYPIKERRDLSRQPFFRPATIFLPGDPSRRIFAFTRDLSTEGIGLLHHVLLEKGEVVVAIHRPPRKPLHVRVAITWCQPCSEAWYLSGGRLLGTKNDK